MNETYGEISPVIVITGTSKGIGHEVARHYLAQGWRVAGCSRGETTIDASHYLHTQVDIGDEKQVMRWIRAVKRVWGRIDVLLSNAGYAPANLLLAMTSGEVIDRLLRTNVAGNFHVCREVAKVMTLQQSGTIITISSMSVGLHEEGTAAYAASKSAIVEMTKIMAKELAPCGITCNVVAPSMLMTDAVRDLGEGIIARALSKLTIKRALSTAEVCNVISFLAAPESRCITGQVIHMGLVC